MVYNRMKCIRIFIILTFTALFLTLLFLKNNSVETNLAKSILPEEVINNTKIIPLLEHSGSTVKVIFESESENDLSELKQNFLQNINKDNFATIYGDFSDLLDWYVKEPANFISPKTRNLLRNKKYDIVYRQGLERLYYPTGFSVAPADKDPFLLLTDFLLGNDTLQKNKCFDGKYYDTEILQINKDAGQKGIKELIITKNKLSDKNNHIYLAGTPVHTHYTTINCTVSINIICALITFLIIFLTFFYFKNFKILLPISLSIAFGFLAGYSVTKYLFNNFHLITFLFGTTLIGIGIDYSYHYVFKEHFNSGFIKNLTLSFLSTAAAFSLLYLAKTDILNQIATFTIIGLGAIYSFIMILYPIINFPAPQKIYSPEFSKKAKISLIIVITSVILLGLPKIKFNDDLSALYKPNKNLEKSEILFGKISNQNVKNNYVIAVKGKSLQDILENEEAVTSQLDKDNVNYICISKFIPSEKRQKENANLVKNLYINELSKYGDILSAAQMNSLNQSKINPLSFNIKEYPFFGNSFLDNETSLIVVFSDKQPVIKSENIEIISVQGALSKYLKQHRKSLQKLLPAIYGLLFLILLISYGFKSSAEMFLPILISQIFVISLLSLISVKLNMFSLLGLILGLGFTIDYAIFGNNNSQKAGSAIFLACVTTALSFFLLIFTTFKLISMLGITTSLCILSSYIIVRIFMHDKQHMV